MGQGRLLRLLLLAGLWSTSGGPPVAEALGEYELKAAYLFQFARFVNWPRPPEGAFNLCLLGSDPFGERLAELQGKTIAQHPLAVKYPATIAAAKSCQVLFINLKSSSELTDALGRLADLPILTVSDSPGAWAKDVTIALVTEPNRVSFRVNLTAARRVGLELSSQLLKLAREIK